MKTVKRKQILQIVTPCIAIGILCYAFILPVFAQENQNTPPLPIASETIDIQKSEPFSEENPLITRGRYLTTAANCYACHTSDPAYPFSGGTGITTPFGTLYPPNITPDQITGIGHLSDDQFYNVLHQGNGKNAEHLYPIMPYDFYTLIKRDDVIAIKTYLFSLRPIRQENKENNLNFPFNMRWILTGWNFFNFKKGAFEPNTSKTDAINRGAYLATALGHCGTCHTPRTLTMGSDNKKGFPGDTITTGWYAPNITPDTVSGIGHWSDEELMQYFKTGTAPGKSEATGPMAKTVAYSLSKMSDQDIQDIIAWLRDQSPVRDKADLNLPNTRTHFEWGHPQDYSNESRISLKDYSANPSAINTNIEPSLFYYGACASCHGIEGNGIPGTGFSSLVRNSSLGHPNPYNVTLVILNGVHKPSIGTQEEIYMPAFKTQFTDEEIMALTNWLFENYGRPQVKITQSEVTKLRAGKNPILPPIISIAKSISIATLALLLIFILGALIRYSPRIKASIGIGKRKKQPKTYIPK